LNSNRTVADVISEHSDDAHAALFWSYIGARSWKPLGVSTATKLAARSTSNSSL